MWIASLSGLHLQVEVMQGWLDQDLGRRIEITGNI